MTNNQDTDKTLWVNKNWLIGILVAVIFGLVGALQATQTINQSDMLKRQTANEGRTQELERKVAALEAGQDRLLAGIQRVEAKADKIIELHVKP